MVRRDNIWKSLDWVTIVIYLMLIVFGWFSVCGASYDYGDRDFLDFSTRAGKQFMWIVCSFGLGFILLMLEDTLYDMFSYIIYIGLILLLVVTIFIAPDTKGSRSWLILILSVCSPAGCTNCPRHYIGQVYERLLVYHKKLEECVDAGFPYPFADDAHYPSEGNGFGIGLYGFLFDALS